MKYIHGLNSTGRRSANQLSEIFNEKVDILSWDYKKSFDENFNNMLAQIDENDEDEILIGSSMGGFYANALCNKLLVPCALFNPVINPLEQLLKLKNIDFFKNVEIPEDIINSYIKPKDTVISRLVVVGKNDTVLTQMKQSIIGKENAIWLLAKIDRQIQAENARHRMVLDNITKQKECENTQHERTINMLNSRKEQFKRTAKLEYMEETLDKAIEGLE